MSHSSTPPEPSVAELVTRLSEQTSRLVRDELKLAQTELSAKAKQAGAGAAGFGVAAVLAWFGFGALVATAIIALALLLPAWAAALIVTVVLFIGAGIAALVGKKKMEGLSPAPERTISNVNRDITEVKERISHDDT